MKVLVTGASGFIGSALVPRLRETGHDAVRLVRRNANPANGTFEWDVASGRIDPRALESADAIIHLAGENIGSGRWTAAKKARLRASRVDATQRLAEHLAALERRPRMLVCGSAIGYYGSRGSELLSETSAPGKGFLADLCRDWEEAAAPARAAGVRVVHVRTGVVLGRGGPLAKMLLPFRLGLGGVIGNGEQYFSWIALDDIVEVFRFALEHEDLAGPINGTTSNPVTNRVFTKTLGKVLGRPTLFPMPAFAARIVFGEMADELLLASARVEPARLAQCGFSFRHSMLDDALRHVLGR